MATNPQNGIQATQATERTPLLSTATQETQLTQPERNENENRISITKKIITPARQIAPDLLRGLLMIFMAEDHVNATAKGYPHGTGLGSEDASKSIEGWTNTLGYVMRTISHLCASGFALLLGMGIAFFIESRKTKVNQEGIKKQGWKPIQYFKHLFQRTIALIFANYIASWMIILQGFWLPNIVLIALAFDYFVVGSLAVLLTFTVEPLLESLWTFFLPEKQDESERRNGRSSIESESARRNASNTTRPRSKRAAFHSSNLLLLLLGTFTLFLTIQVDPKRGNCNRSSNEHLTGEGDVQALLYESMFFKGKEQTPSKWLTEKNCTDDPTKLIWNFLFYPTTCHGIVSGFPPMAWLPFAIFGLLYGRLLLARTQTSQKRSTSSGKGVQEALHNITLEASLAIVFAMLFVATRIMHFGNLSENCLPSSSKKNPYLQSIKAFFYVVKYPPSPSFAFFTLSGNFALLVFFAIATSSVLSPSILVNALRSDANPLLVFGRQSLFFYVVHLVIASISGPLLLKSPLAHTIKKGDWDGKTKEYGIGLGYTFFGFYALLLIVMYPLCRAYAKFKSRQSSDSIWRFF